MSLRPNDPFSMITLPQFDRDSHRVSNRYFRHYGGPGAHRQYGDSTRTGRIADANIGSITFCRHAVGTDR